MLVRDHEPHAWFLLEDAGAFVMAVRCSRGPADFELLIRLAPDEEREYRALGSVYLHYLAARVHHWSRDYEPRHERASQAAVDEAIERYLAPRDT